MLILPPHLCLADGWSDTTRRIIVRSKGWLITITQTMRQIRSWNRARWVFRERKPSDVAIPESLVGPRIIRHCAWLWSVTRA